MNSNSYITSFKVLVIGHWTSISYTQIVKHIVVSLSPTDKPMWDFTKIENQKRELVDKYDRIAKKWKVIILEVKLDVVRFENGHSKAKIGWDLGLREATVQATV